MPINYISPSLIDFRPMLWLKRLDNKDLKIKTIQSKIPLYWMSGFLEGRGEFNINNPYGFIKTLDNKGNFFDCSSPKSPVPKKEESEIANFEFRIILSAYATDINLLNLIKQLLYIPEKIKNVKSEQQGTTGGTGKNQLILKTTSFISITTLINIFTSVDLKFKGIQSLKFKL